MPDIPEQPKASADDVAHTIVKAAISAVPAAGGPAAELMTLIFAPPLEKRREKWLGKLADAVNEILGKVADLTPEKLSQNDAFITTALHAGQIASRTHEVEKLTALRNAVVNSVLPGAPDDALQQIFLEHVDALTPWHLRILAYFDNPQEWASHHNIHFPQWTAGAPSQALEIAIPELTGRRQFYDVICASLERRQLLGSGIHGMMTGQGMLAQRTTSHGRDFLAFISRH
jgi:hypothetical protein